MYISSDITALEGKWLTWRSPSLANRWRGRKYVRQFQPTELIRSPTKNQFLSSNTITMNKVSALIPTRCPQISRAKIENWIPLRGISAMRVTLRSEVPVCTLTGVLSLLQREKVEHSTKYQPRKSVISARAQTAVVFATASTRRGIPMTRVEPSRIHPNRRFLLRCFCCYRSIFCRDQDT